MLCQGILDNWLLCLARRACLVLSARGWTAEGLVRSGYLYMLLLSLANEEF